LRICAGAAGGGDSPTPMRMSSRCSHICGRVPRSRNWRSRGVTDAGRTRWETSISSSPRRVRPRSRNSSRRIRA
jgi:hypothetical protein